MIIFQEVMKNKETGEYFAWYGLPYETNSKGYSFVDGFSLKQKTPIPFAIVTKIYKTPEHSIYELFERVSIIEVAQQAPELFARMKGNILIHYAVIDTSMPTKDAVNGVYEFKQDAINNVIDQDIVEVFVHIS